MCSFGSSLRSICAHRGDECPRYLGFQGAQCYLFPEFLGSAAVEVGLAFPSEGLGCAGKASEICPQGALWTRARGTPAAAGLGGPPTRLIPTRWEWGTAIHPSPGEGEKDSRLQRHSQKCENNWKPGRDRQQPPWSDLCPSGDLVLHLVGVGCVFSSIMWSLGVLPGRVCANNSHQRPKP